MMVRCSHCNMVYDDSAMLTHLYHPPLDRWCAFCLLLDTMLWARLGRVSSFGMETFG